MKKVIALIADIVDSRSIPDRQVFQRVLKNSLQVRSEGRPEAYLSPLTLTLGDEFQAVYAAFDRVLPDMLTVLSIVYPYQLRAAVAIGTLSTDINPKAALEMDGPAFNLARELIERLKKQQCTTIQVAGEDDSRLKLINSSLRLIGNRLSEWKQNSLLIACGLAKGESVQGIADSLSITPRAVNKNIATNHIRDTLNAMFDLSDEMTRILSLSGSGLSR